MGASPSSKALRSCHLDVLQSESSERFRRPIAVYRKKRKGKRPAIANVTECTFSGNAADEFGGAISVTGNTKDSPNDVQARLSVETSAFTQNSANAGGAINVAANGVVRLSDGCTLTENVATTRGGIRVGTGKAYVLSTEFVDNDADASSDVHKNSAGTLVCPDTCPAGRSTRTAVNPSTAPATLVCVPEPRRVRHARSGADAAARAWTLPGPVGRARTAADGGAQRSGGEPDDEPDCRVDACSNFRAYAAADPRGHAAAHFGRHRAAEHIRVRATRDVAHAAAEPSAHAAACSGGHAAPASSPTRGRAKHAAACSGARRYPRRRPRRGGQAPTPRPAPGGTPLPAPSPTPRPSRAPTPRPAPGGRRYPRRRPRRGRAKRPRRGLLRGHAATRVVAHAAAAKRPRRGLLRGTPLPAVAAPRRAKRRAAACSGDAATRAVAHAAARARARPGRAKRPRTACSGGHAATRVVAHAAAEPSARAACSGERRCPRRRHAAAHADARSACADAAPTATLANHPPERYIHCPPVHGVALSGSDLSRRAGPTRRVRG